MVFADGVALSEGRELAGGGREWRWGFAFKMSVVLAKLWGVKGDVCGWCLLRSRKGGRKSWRKRMSATHSFIFIRADSSVPKPVPAGATNFGRR